MCNLNEVTYYDDPVDQWAAQLEFELRDRKYAFYREGGLIGAMNRVTQSLKKFERAFVGAQADE